MTTDGAPTLQAFLDTPAMRSFPALRNAILRDKAIARR